MNPECQRAQGLSSFQMGGGRNNRSVSSLCLSLALRGPCPARLGAPQRSPSAERPIAHAPPCPPCPSVSMASADDVRGGSPRPSVGRAEMLAGGWWR